MAARAEGAPRPAAHQKTAPPVHRCPGCPGGRDGRRFDLHHDGAGCPLLAEIERANKAIGSSLEAAPEVYITDAGLAAALAGVDLAEVCITSAIDVRTGAAPAGAFTLPDVAGVAVVPKRAEGRKCARSWRITSDVGADPDFPDLSARDAAAVREFDARHPAGA